MQIQAAQMGHETMSNCAEETAGGKISLVGKEDKTGSSTLGNGQTQMQPANGVIVAIKSNGSNGNNGSSVGNNDCTKTDLSNGNNGNMGGVRNKEKGEVEVGVKSCSNGVKSVSALLNGMQLSYQAKAVDAVLTGKVTNIILDKNK